MRWRHFTTGIAITLGLLVGCAESAAADTSSTSVELFGQPVILSVEVVEQTAPVLTPIPLTAPIPPDWSTIAAFLRAQPSEWLIRWRWAATPHADLMVRIARRESGLRCDADNPTSSAAGLFQTMGFHRRLAEGIGLSWSNITGPDCLDDIVLAWQLYDNGRGLRHWNATRW